MPTADPRKALIVISSATVLPLAEPRDRHGIPTGIPIGFSPREVARVFQEFGDDHDLVVATPDGTTPTVDVNGLALSCFPNRELPGGNPVRSDLDRYRHQHADLIVRRDAELETLREHLGRLAVSPVLPHTDREVAEIHGKVTEMFETVSPRPMFSVRRILERHRAPTDPLDLAGFSFAHLPGGPAAMTDLVDNPWLGELLNTLRELGVPVSLTGHGAVALTSVRHRVDTDGKVRREQHHGFLGAEVATVARHNELRAMTTGALRVPGRRTRPTYFVDEVLTDQGFLVRTTGSAGTPKVVWDARANLLTGNGPAAIDELVDQLRVLVDQLVEATVTPASG